MILSVLNVSLLYTSTKQCIDFNGPAFCARMKIFKFSNNTADVKVKNYSQYQEAKK